MSVNGVVDDHLLAVVLVLRISDIKTSQTLHDDNNTFCLQGSKGVRISSG